MKDFHGLNTDSGSQPSPASGRFLLFVTYKTSRSSGLHHNYKIMTFTALINCIAGFVTGCHLLKSDTHIRGIPQHFLLSVRSPGRIMSDTDRFFME